MKINLENGNYMLTIENGETHCRKINLEKQVDLKINWFKFVKSIICSKGCRCWLLLALQYAISKENEVYGEGAADVLAFEVYFKDSINFKKDKDYE